MKPSRLLLALAATLLLTAAAPADAPVTDWSNIEVVTVTPDHPGPPLWHIAKGDSEVWIIATVSPVPNKLKWDKTSIEDLMKGANAVLLPPSASVGIVEGLWFYMWHMDRLEQPDGMTLEASLPEPLRGRFVAARQRAHEDADRYAKYLPAVAALMLEGDYLKSVDFNAREPQRTLEAIASHAGVRTRAVANYPAMDVVNDVPKMSAEANRACVEYALSDIDTLSAHGTAAAEAWAVGDMAGIKANFSETKLDACLGQNNAYVALRERAIRDEVNAITAALAKPGKTIVVVPMGFFLRKGAVLDRLEAAGYAVTGPG
ncbi:MAG: TraB/GumN family protein [Proteobacteria bacterium]|nr:TraB/GumN family protein [Pseudomonadota bacterium]